MKKLLSVNYHFFPVYNVSVKQFAKYFKYLPDYGWYPLVLTKDWKQDFAKEDKGWGLRFEPEMKASIGYDIEIYRAPYRHYNNRLMSWHNSLKRLTGSQAPMPQRIVLSPLRKCLSSVWPLFGLYPDRFIGWIDAAVKEAAKIMHEEGIQAILSSCPPQTNHLVASKLARKFRIPWIAYFGDLYGFYIGSEDWYGTKWKQFMASVLNNYWLRPASYALAVSPYMVELINELYGLKGEVVVVGFDESDFPESSTTPKNDKLTISHIGSIYLGDQRPEIFLDALDRLLQMFPKAQEHLDIQFIGSRCEAQLRELVANRICEKVCSIQPKVSGTEAVRLQQSTDILLLFNLTSARSKNGTLSYPSKIFEYFGAKRPILAIPGDSGWVDRLLTMTQSGYIADSIEEVENVLERWYFTWRQTGRIPYKGNLEKISLFSHREQAKRIVSTLDKVTSS